MRESFEQRRVSLAKLISGDEHKRPFKLKPGESLSAMRHRIYECERLRDFSWGKVAAYERAFSFGADFPPVFVFDLNGSLFLQDGWHRCAAAAIGGHDSISAVVFRISSAEEGDFLSALLFDLRDSGTPWCDSVRSAGVFLRARRGVGEAAE